MAPDSVFAFRSGWFIVIPMLLTSVRSARRMCKYLAPTLLICTMAAGDPSTDVSDRYVGVAVCAPCHRNEAEQQATSAHAHALSPATSHLSVFRTDADLFRPPRYRFRFLTDDGRLRVAISGSDDTLELPIDWAFGAGKQATTFVGRLDPERYVEHYLSYYAASNSFRATPGQIGYPSNTLSLASGLTYPTLDPVIGIIKCFECHSTGPPVIGGGNEITPLELGVRCEACHGPGGRHVDAVVQGRATAAKTLILDPARLSGERLNQICGKCHRTLNPNTTFDWNKAWNVRQQPVYLSQSACFLRSKGKLSCLSCHSPHQPLETNLATYDNKCRSCHNPSKHPAVEREIGSTCVSCHMPVVGVQENLAFTNHWIGIYSGASKTRPVR